MSGCGASVVALGMVAGALAFSTLCENGAAPANASATSTEPIGQPTPGLSDM